MENGTLLIVAMEECVMREMMGLLVVEGRIFSKGLGGDSLIGSELLVSFI